MTYEQAVTIRTMQLNGHYIAPLLALEAIEIIKRTRTPTARPRTKGTRLSREEYRVAREVAAKEKAE